MKLLSENHWTTSCVVTMRKFRDICGGTNEAFAVLSYLSGIRKAMYVSVSRKELIEVHNMPVVIIEMLLQHCTSVISWVTELLAFRALKFPFHLHQYLLPQV